jgi:hypothetical protein
MARAASPARRGSGLVEVVLNPLKELAINRLGAGEEGYLSPCFFKGQDL